MTDEELLSLVRLPDFTEKQSGPSRFATGAISAPARAVGGIADAFKNWFGRTGVNPEDELVDGITRAEADELTANPTPEGIGQWVGEIGNQLSPMALQIYLTGKAVAPIANVTKYPLAAATVRNAAEFGVLGSQHSSALGLEQAAEGAGYGLARALPNKYRWPVTGAIALASKQWFDAHDPNPIAPEVLGGTTQGDVNALLGFATSFGKQVPLRGVTNHLSPKVEPTINGGWEAPRTGTARTNVSVKPEGTPLETWEARQIVDEVLGGQAPAQSPVESVSQTPIGRPNFANEQNTVDVALAQRKPVTPSQVLWDQYYTNPAEGGSDYEDLVLQQMQKQRLAAELGGIPSPSEPRAPIVPTLRPTGNASAEALTSLQRPPTPAAATEGWWKTEAEVAKANQQLKGKLDAEADKIRWQQQAGNQPATVPSEWEAMVEQRRRAMYGEPRATDAAPEPAFKYSEVKAPEPVAPSGYRTPDWSIMENRPTTVEAEMLQRAEAARVKAQVDAEMQQARARLNAANPEADHVAVKGKLAPRRSWEKEAGGLSDDMSQAMGKATLGAVGGAGIGAPSGHPELGAAIGLVAAVSPALAKKLASFAKQSNRVDLIDNFIAKASLSKPKSEQAYRAANLALNLQEHLALPEVQKYVRTYEEPLARIRSERSKLNARIDQLRDLDKPINEQIEKVHNAYWNQRYKDAGAKFLLEGDEAGIPTSDLSSIDLIAKSNKSKAIDNFLNDPIAETFNQEQVEALFQNRNKINSEWKAINKRLADLYEAERKVTQRAEELFGIDDSNEAISKYHNLKHRINKLQKASSEPVATNAKGLQKLDKGEAGFALPAVNQAMARAALGAAGGAVAGSMTDEHGENSGLAMGAIVGGLLAAFGPEAAIGLKKFLTTERLPTTKTSTSNVLKFLAQRREELAGRAFNNVDVMSRFVRWIDRALEGTMAPDIKQALIRSEGVANFHVSQIDAALERLAKGYEPNQKLIEAANRFLDGDDLTAEQFAQIAKTLDPASGNYAEFVITAREHINALQRMIMSGANDAQAKIVNDSLGKYLTRSYKLFTHKAWMPSQESIDNVVAQLKKTEMYKDASEEQLRFHLRHYIKEAKIKKTFYSGVTDEGERIAQTAFKERKHLQDAWLDFLGVITDPKERILHTAVRLKPMAEAGNYFATIAKEPVEGMVQVFDNYAAVEAMRTNLQSKLASASGAEAEQIKLNLAKLESVHLLDKQPQYGNLEGKLVTRNVADSLAGIEQFANPSNGVFRSLSKFHTLIKMSDTVLHPITMLRNYLAAPVMMGIARVNPARLKDAHQILTNSKHPLTKEIFEMGIANADQVSGELIRDYKQATGGSLDLTSTVKTMLGLTEAQAHLVSKSATTPLHLMQKAYAYPDNLTRVAAYLSARTRFADKLGLPETAAEVKDLAAKFVHRYTMNYAAVIPAVKIARQVPFVSQYLSYFAESGRILKNLTEDVLKGENGFNHSRMLAATVLSTLAFGPEVIKGEGESNLSPSELAEWKRAQALMPEWERGAYKYVHGKKDGKFQYSTFSPLIPTDSFNQMFASIAKGDYKAAIANNPILSRENTPMLNLASSIVYGEDYKTHRKFRGFGDFASVAAREILPPWFPTGAEFEKFQQAYTPNSEGGTGLKIKHRNITPEMVWKPYWSGMRLSETSLQELQRMAVQKAKSAIATEVSYLNDVLKSNAAPEVKAPVIERSRKAIQLIQASLRDQLQSGQD